jgi:hypothetical protein
MPNTENSKDYKAWLEQQRKLAAEGDEKAQDRVATANLLEHTRRSREFNRSHDDD